MRWKKAAAFLTAACLSVSAAGSVGAASTEEKIESIRSEKASTESSLAAAEERIAVLEGLQGDLEAYLSELNAQYEELTASLETLTAQAREKEAQLEQVKLDLRQAKRQEAEQYAAMKLRISYMYENGEMSGLEALLSADSFADFLDRVDNMIMIGDYDRDMLEKYQETRREVADKKKQVAQEQQEIERLWQECAGKREEIQQLEDSTQAEIAEYQLQINDKQSEAAGLMALVQEQSATLDSLVAQMEAERAAAEKAEAEARRRAEAEAAQAQQQESQEQEQEQEQEAAAQPESGSDDTPEEPALQQEPAESPESQESSSSSGGTYLGNFKLTAYCNCAQCCGTAGNYTASGTWPTPGRTVAMAGVPFGTKLSINGNIYTVEDLGTPYGHVDIYCSSHAEALAFGLQYADVYQVD